MSVPRPAMLVAMVTRAALAGAGDDLGLLRVELRVEHGVRDLRALEHAGERLGRLDGDGADEDRLALRVGFLDLLDDGVELLAAGLEDLVVLVDADVRPVGRDRQHVELVDVVELGGFGFGGAGHAGELLVEAEVVLDGDGREGLGFLLDGDAFLGLDRLVQAVGPAAARHFAAGVFVDDDHLVVLDDVLDVLFDRGSRP